MARYTDAVCRLCRREGIKLFLKGTKCFSDKCPIEKRNFAPGQHGKDKKTKVVGYGLHNGLPRAFRQNARDELRFLVDADFRQNADLITERGYPPPGAPGGLTIRMRRLSVIEAEQLLRVVVQDLVSDFLR